MCLGIATLHGRPRHPQTQGKEERFHRTLDVDVLQGRQFADLEHCQRAFNAWRPIYNEQRPHEELGLDVALRPTETDGVWSLHFMRFNLGWIDTRGPKAILTTVRDVSEHPSSISPV